MNEEYRQATGEAYIPQECEHYGFNEVGGMMLTEDGWVEHCMSYRDSALLPELLTEN